MAQAAQSRGFFGFLPKQQKRNIFGWSKKEKTARRKHVGASATEARGAGYRYATHKSDENFSEWMDRKDFGGKIKSNEKERLASAFSMGFDRGKKELEFKASKAVRKEEKRKKKKEDATAKRQKRSTDAKKSGIGKKSFWTAAGLAADEKWNPARSAAQYRLAQAVLSGTARSSMPRKVAQEIVDRTPAKLRSQYMKNPTSHMRPASRRNEFGRGGKATGAGAGGAGGGAGAGSQGGRSSTDVRSPTRTSTSTEAETTGNIWLARNRK